MKKYPFCFLALFCFSINLSAFDPSTVQWSEVKSKVRWLNFYTESGFLTLKIDDFEALKKVAPGRSFALTLFPPGQYQSHVINSYNKKTVESFQLKVDNSKIYTLISLGAAKFPCKTLILEDDTAIRSKGQSNIQLVNAFPDKTLLWTVDKIGKNEEPFKATLAPAGKGETAIETKDGFASTARILGLNQSLTLHLPTDETDKNWVILVYPDPENADTPRFGYFQEGDHPYFSE